MKDQLPLWVQYLQVFSIPVLAAFGAWIAYRQYCTASEKVRLELFEKRWEVFGLIQQLCHNVLKDLHPSYDDIRISVTARGKAKFLFDDDVNDYLNVLHNKTIRLRFLATSLENPDYPERDKLAEEKSTLSLEFTELVDRLSDQFVRYMKFTDAKRRC